MARGKEFFGIDERLVKELGDEGWVGLKLAISLNCLKARLRLGPECSWGCVEDGEYLR